MPTFVDGEEDHDSVLDLAVGTARVFVSSSGDGEIESAGAGSTMLVLPGRMM